MNTPHNFEGFGPIYVINLERSPERKENMIAQFEEHGITDFSFVTAIDAAKDLEAQGVVIEQNPVMMPTEHACAASHFLAIEHWLNTSDSPYAIFFEDDMSFELVKNWKISWKDLFEQLPEECVVFQMSSIRIEWQDSHMRLRERDKGEDWSSGVYLIHREYAQTLVSKHIKDGLIKTIVNMGIAENVLFNDCVTYVYPMFVELAESQSTIRGNSHDGLHAASRNKILEFFAKMD
jgi:GR25 family glycosyltransferase involved in LPS biosynthesis